jgi:hypothetical protein
MSDPLAWTGAIGGAVAAAGAVVALARTNRALFRLSSAKSEKDGSRTGNRSWLAGRVTC